MAIWVSKDPSQLGDLKYELQNHDDNYKFFDKIKNTKIIKILFVFLCILFCKTNSKIYVAQVFLFP